MIWQVVVVATVGYLLSVRALRFRRRDSLREYGFTDRASLGRMTLQDAFAIQLPLAELEFPRSFVFFAIFKTYAIPSISALLAATGQLSNPDSASKRAADTGILVAEAVLHEPGSDRSLDAVARMNFLHDRYRRAGKIKDDMLYTISLFCLEPIRWTRKFEWRDLSDVVLCAMDVYWKSLGDRMKIPYDRLPSRETGWTDGLYWLEELQDWSTAYEVKNMVPAATNHQLSTATIKIALTNVPRVLHALGRDFVSALLEERLRMAMQLPEPSRRTVTALETVLGLRRFALRHLCLPRPHRRREQWFSQRTDPHTGRYHAKHYIDRPWYIEPTFWNRWDPVSWLIWAVGGDIASEHRPENRPEGYRIPDLGPENMQGKGVEEMKAARAVLAEQVKRCPFGHGVVA